MKLFFDELSVSYCTVLAKENKKAKTFPQSFCTMTPNRSANFG